MAKSRRHISRRSKMNTTIQVVYSEKRKIFVKKYLTKKGKEMMAINKLSEEEALKLYGKNRYRINRNAIAIKVIAHN